MVKVICDMEERKAEKGKVEGGGMGVRGKRANCGITGGREGGPHWEGEI